MKEFICNLIQRMGTFFNPKHEKQVQVEKANGNTRKLQRFLLERFDFRYNLLTGVTEYRPKSVTNIPFSPIEERNMNGMIVDARLKGIASTSPEKKLVKVGLINLDEFDKISEKRQPDLKNLLQMVSVPVYRGMVSHETMYRWIWKDKRKKGTLYQYLRRKGKKYNKRGNSLAGRGHIPNRVDIEERPAIVDLKERFGDLEIDTVIGSNHKGALVTINDRLTSKVWIRKLSGKDAAPLALKTIEALRPIKDLIHTITADNGKGFAKHQEIAKELEISFYFCKPYQSWERGANENMNGLIRQYIPKGTDFSGITDEFVAWVEEKLNNRPRKRLGYLTPNEKFNLF